MIKGGGKATLASQISKQAGDLECMHACVCGGALDHNRGTRGGCAPTVTLAPVGATAAQAPSCTYTEEVHNVGTVAGHLLYLQGVRHERHQRRVFGVRLHDVTRA